MAENKITPGVLVSTLRDNQNNNKSLKSQFSTQFLGKLSYDELIGLKQSIEKEKGKRAKGKIKDEIEFLKSHGYKVSAEKKK